MPKVMQVHTTDKKGIPRLAKGVYKVPMGRLYLGFRFHILSPDFFGSKLRRTKITVHVAQLKRAYHVELRSLFVFSARYHTRHD